MSKEQQKQRSSIAKLSKEQSKEIIRRNLAGERDKSLADEFGVSPSTISMLVRGLRWHGIEGPRRTESRQAGTGNHLAKLTDVKVREIRIARASGASYLQIAKQHGVATNTILAIIHNRTWKQVEQ